MITFYWEEGARVLLRTLEDEKVIFVDFVGFWGRKIVRQIFEVK